MKQYYVCSKKRRDAADLFFAEGLDRLDVSVIGGLDEAIYASRGRVDEIVAIWNEDPRRSPILPSSLICNDGSADDWTAWLTTYLPKIRPISAFSRLFERSEFESCVRRYREPYMNSAIWPAVGLIIGEVLASATVSDRQLEQLSLSAYESTLSFALFRSFAITGDTLDFPMVKSSWEAARHLTKQHPRAIDPSITAQVCELALRAGHWAEVGYSIDSVDYDQLSLLESMLEDQTSEFIGRRLSSILGIKIEVNGTREERVASFARVIDRVSMSSADHTRSVLSLVLGFLASRIAPGTIQHASVLSPIIRDYPATLLWYGFLAGSGKETSTERKTSSHSGAGLPMVARWISRALLRRSSPWETPSCDIGWRELNVLSKTGVDPLANIIRANQGSADIEIAPGVWTVMNVTTKSEIGDSGRRTRTVRNEHLMSTIQDSLARLNQAIHDLTSEQAPEPQASLFPSTKRRRTGS